MPTDPESRQKFFKRLWTSRLGTAAALWQKLPLAAFAGLRVTRLDQEGAEVLLPAGWRTQNPFRSTYFAAQAMAAELSTGVPALYFIEGSGVPVASLVTTLTARFTKKATRPVTFRFAGGSQMRAAVEQTVKSGEPVTYTARSIGTQDDGVVVAEFEITWSFKRRSSAGAAQAA